MIAFLGYYIRIQNVPILNGNLADPDAHVVYRYAKYIVDNGNLMKNDVMRYYPVGFDPRPEFSALSYSVAYFYKISHLFDSSITFTHADIIFPAAMFFIAIIIFFFLVKKLFDFRIALLASLLLTIIPGFLFRTISGVADKEALAIIPLFASIFLYFYAIESNNPKKVIIASILSGILTAFLALVWGGVTYVLITLGTFAIVEIFLDRFSKKDCLIYTLWFIPAVVIMLISGRFTFSTLISSFTTGLMILGFYFTVMHYLFNYKNIFKIKDKIKFNLPNQAKLFLVALIIFILITSIFLSPTFVIDKGNDIVKNILNPFKTRWAQTVAESNRPYIVSWPSQFAPGNIGWLFIWLMILGSIFLFYRGMKPLKAHLKLTFAYTIFLLLFIFDRYSPSSKLNGDSTLSHILFFGSILAFGAYLLYYYFHSYYKNPEEFENISKTDKKLTLIIIWSLLAIIGAKTAIRLVFVLIPIAAILISYVIFELIDIISKNRKKEIKIATYIVILLIVGFFALKTYNVTLSQARGAGPIYNQQWQMAGDWVKQNTPNDAVFAHWWDYGYLVQTGFERATVTDGGNAIGPWNYYMAREVLTAQNLKEPLPFLKTHNVSYLLIVADEIGKYPAFSLIGSDEKYDRYGWIGTYALDPSQTQETRNQTILLYRGGVNLDEDFVFQGKILPRNSAGIAGFLLPLKKEGSTTSFGQPTAVIIYNNQRYDVPLECIFVQDSEIVFNSDENTLKGCLRLIPVFQSQTEANPIGAGLYLSPRIRKTLLAHLYIYGEKSDIFQIAYSDENNLPLSIYQGRLLGPMKIWKVNYPSDVKTDPVYLRKDFVNPKVTEINPAYG